MDIEQIARICHEANREYCCTLGDYSQPAWDTAPEWQRDSCIKGVKFCLENPGAPASSNHDAWLKDKLDTGWKYGPVKIPDLKEHPCCVPYDELPDDQKVKDYIFKGIVGACTPFWNGRRVGGGIKADPAYDTSPSSNEAGS